MGTGRVITWFPWLNTHIISVRKVFHSLNVKPFNFRWRKRLGGFGCSEDWVKVLSIRSSTLVSFNLLYTNKVSVWFVKLFCLRCSRFFHDKFTSSKYRFLADFFVLTKGQKSHTSFLNTTVVPICNTSKTFM